MITLRRFGPADDQLPPVAGRYRLVVSPLCPWCRRVAITRRLLGLEDAIAISQATGRDDDGFIFESPGQSFDVELRVRSVRELYRRQKDWQVGDPTTVPVVIDNDGHIVAGESGDLLHDFHTQFKDLQTIDRDLYPESERDHIDKVDKLIDEHIAAKVVGFLHEDAEQRICALAGLIPGLDWAERHLEDQGFIACDEPHESDIRMFAHLTSLWNVRFSSEDVERARDKAAHAKDVDASHRCQVYTLPDEPPANKAATKGECSVVNLADHAPQGATPSFSFPSINILGGASGALSASACSFGPGPSQDTQPQILSYWPSVYDWWKTLSAAPGWVGRVERDALEIPRWTQLQTEH